MIDTVTETAGPDDVVGVSEEHNPHLSRPRRAGRKTSPPLALEGVPPLPALAAQGAGPLPAPYDEPLPAVRPEPEALLPAVEAPGVPSDPDPEGGEPIRKPPRRRPHRGGRNRRRPATARADTPAATADPEVEIRPDLPEETAGETAPAAQTPPAEPSAVQAPASDEASTPPPPGKSRSRSRGRRARARAARAAAPAETGEQAPETDMDAAPPADVEENGELAEAVSDAGPERKARAGQSAETAASAKKTDRKMLISVIPGDLVEVALLEKGKVLEYYVEMVHHAKIRGNIYKGVINNIDANLQAAFVNYGNVKNGFLQIDEVHPEYWLIHHDPAKGHKYPPIQKALKPGQEVLVQVVKEPVGNKGAFLTTWISLAGRFLVLMPGQEQIGISRKVEDGEERNRLRELIKGIDPGPGLGAIVRTVSAGTGKTTLQKDLNFLKRVWKDIRKRATTEKAPCQIYQEPGLASRAVRDYLSEDVTEIWVDDAETAEAIREMTSLLYPRKADLVHLYRDAASLWDRFGIRRQLEQVYSREVQLPSGGRLVFDQTEALMAVDINSGKIGGKSNFEAMAHRTNMEAAEAIALQLRLRDVGGQIVVDFIEMHDPEHCREVEKTLRTAMKGDRARHDIGKMSSFGLLQIVRQRTGTSAISISTEPCPHCRGTGMRRNMEWQALQALREIERRMRAASGEGKTELIQVMEPEAALYLLNRKRERLCDLERTVGVRLDIRLEGAER